MYQMCCSYTVPAELSNKLLLCPRHNVLNYNFSSSDCDILLMMLLLKSFLFVAVQAGQYSNQHPSPIVINTYCFDEII